jgi:hypothetical protein
MRIDFHFYTIYVLARAAGFSPDDAHVVAYSSQYTDDEVSENDIWFEGGDIFKPHITAHRIYDPHAVTTEIAKAVWMPYHFVPGNTGTGDERLITRTNGPVIKEIINEFLNTDFDIILYGLHLLGIILHAYADTFSHQDFVGIRNEMNRVDDLKISGEEVPEFLAYRMLPTLGHAQVGSTPDEPYREWEYWNYSGEHEIHNHQRALDAAQFCYALLIRFLGQFPKFVSFPPVSWKKLEGKLGDLFENNQDIEACRKAWREAITKAEFWFVPQGRDIDLEYSEREWFEAAVRKETLPSESGQLEDRYIKEENFDRSNFKLFNDAASYYGSTLYQKIIERENLELALI